jgi:uncharacterized membrane protein YgcG
MGCTASSTGLDYHPDAPTTANDNVKNSKNEVVVTKSPPLLTATLPVPLAQTDDKAAEPARRKVKKFIKPPEQLVSSCSEESEIEADGFSVNHAKASSSSSSGEGGGGSSGGGERLTFDEEFWRFHDLPTSGKMR